MKNVRSKRHPCRGFTAQNTAQILDAGRCHGQFFQYHCCPKRLSRRHKDTEKILGTKQNTACGAHDCRKFSGFPVLSSWRPLFSPSLSRPPLCEPCGSVRELSWTRVFQCKKWLEFHEKLKSHSGPLLTVEALLALCSAQWIPIRVLHKRRPRKKRSGPTAAKQEQRDDAAEKHGIRARLRDDQGINREPLECPAGILDRAGTIGSIDAHRLDVV